MTRLYVTKQLILAAETEFFTQYFWISAVISSSYLTV